MRISPIAGVLLLAACTATDARVTEINVAAVEPFADGASYGTTGAYERVRGTFKGELDPADARNKVIVNLDRAPRNARGRVEYEADFFLLRPADAARGNHKIIYDVTNRGRKFIHARLMDAKPASVAATNDPKSADDAGTGLFFRMGYTLAWSGWDSEAPRTANGMAMKPVIATADGKTIVRLIRDELVSGTRTRVDPPKPGEPPRAQTFKLSYEAATLDQSQAKLTARRGETDERVEIPAARWAYAGPRALELLPAGTQPEPGTLYEFHYPAKDPRVLGIGMAATRDLISFLRNDAADSKGNANPARPGIRTTLAFGISQSGRFLRDFVHDGFNQDEGARKVFDGVLAHTGGAGGVFLNHEFAQANRTGTQHEDHTFPENAFPFSSARMTDPVTGKTAGLLRGDGFDPLWMETNTSTEYWQKGASLLVTDPLGVRDVELPGHARAYLIAGTQHGGAAWMTSTQGSCVNPRNPHSPTPALRALLVALDEWASEGRLPPPSMTPRIGDQTFTTPEQLAFPAIPGIAVARRVNAIGVLKDWVKPEMDMSRPYRTLVTQVDADGNEIAGIRLTDIAVPLATYTGWNYYRAPFPAGELCDRDGTYKPFAATREEREAAKDPRLSLGERYGNHADYVKKVEAAAAKLVAARVLLNEDAERLIARARSDEIRGRFAQ
ncbi:MAG: alpha/beta hydrolase domain-containing protein [Burkholderiales bacterium]